MAEEPDLYGILGVDPRAGEEEIRHAYRVRARACHPDRVAGLDVDLQRVAAEKMVQLNRAYAILRSSELRSRYDATRGVQPSLSSSSTSPQRPTAPRAERGSPRGRMQDAGIVARGAAEQLRARLRASLPDFQWTEIEVPEMTIALEGRQGRRRRQVLLIALAAVGDENARGVLRKFQNHVRGAEESWWQDSRVLGVIGAIRFEGRDGLVGAVERFNEMLRNTNRPLSTVLVDLVSWQAAPGPSDLDASLRSWAGGKVA